MGSVGPVRTKLTLNVEKNLVQEAKEMGINLSAFFRDQTGKIHQSREIRTRRDFYGPAGIRTRVRGSEGLWDIRYPTGPKDIELVKIFIFCLLN